MRIFISLIHIYFTFTYVFCLDIAHKALELLLKLGLWTCRLCSSLTRRTHHSRSNAKKVELQRKAARRHAESFPFPSHKTGNGVAHFAITLARPEGHSFPDLGVPVIIIPCHLRRLIGLIISWKGGRLVATSVLLDSVRLSSILTSLQSP